MKQRRRKKFKEVYSRPIYTVEQRLLQGDSDNYLVTMLITDLRSKLIYIDGIRFNCFMCNLAFCLYL